MAAHVSCILVLQMDLDKKSEPCTTYDVIVNHDIVKQSSVCRPLKSFLITTTLQWVSHKTKSELSEKYKLPKMRYKGDAIQSQRIRVDKKALVTEICSIEEVDDEPSFPLLTKRLPAPTPQPVLPSQEASQAGQNHGSAGAGPAGPQSSGGTSGMGGASSRAEPSTRPTPPHVLTPVVQFVGRPVTRVDITIALPPPSSHTIHSSSDSGTTKSSSGSSRVGSDGSNSNSKLGSSGGQRSCKVEVSARSVYVSIPGCADLCVQLSLAVTHRSALATLDSSGASLVLQLPYLPLATLVEELRKEQPHGKGELQLADTSYLELEM